jgi:hypothetical protein
LLILLAALVVRVQLAMTRDYIHDEQHGNPALERSRSPRAICICPFVERTTRAARLRREASSTLRRRISGIA